MCSNSLLEQEHLHTVQYYQVRVVRFKLTCYGKIAIELLQVDYSYSLWFELSSWNATELVFRSEVFLPMRYSRGLHEAPLIDISWVDVGE